MLVMNLVTTKATAKLKLLFIKAAPVPRPQDSFLKTQVILKKAQQCDQT
jgi:hypothetical protein